jgi:hypothetical protein
LIPVLHIELVVQTVKVSPAVEEAEEGVEDDSQVSVASLSKGDEGCV